MYCNGEQIRKLRAQMGFTQEKLAAMSAVNIRTVQRAENGEPLELETFNQLAQALNTTPIAIQSRRADDDIGNENGFVVLRPTLEGAKLVQAVRKAFETDIEYDAEPTDDTIELLVELVENLKAVSQKPWDYGWVVNGIGVPSDGEVLRIQLGASKFINQLAMNGIDVFFGTYIAARKDPHVSEEGHMYTSTNQKKEPKTVVLVRISNTGPERIKVAVVDEWSEPKGEDFGRPDFDDEIPF